MDTHESLPLENETNRQVSLSLTHWLTNALTYPEKFTPNIKEFKFSSKDYIPISNGHL